MIFESFQSGYLKKLDYGKVRELGAIARRLYRYLDKHFHPPLRTTLTLNLKEFAFEHIGVSRNNDAAQIRRALEKPIEELESIGFLLPMSRRFRKVQGQRGEWEAVFSWVGHPAKQKPTTTIAKPTKQVPGTASRRKPDRIDRYIAALPATRRVELETEALQSASGFLLETLQSQEDGPLADECRNQIVKAYLSTKLTQRSS